jgi:hypothetical protein
MHLDKVAARWGFLNRFVLSPAQAANEVVASWHAMPTVDTGLADQPIQPDNYCARLFRYVRWKYIEYEMYFVKTMYHNFAIEISYDPGHVPGFIASTEARALNTYRVILQGKDMTAFRFRVPYISPTPVVETIGMSVSDTSFPLPKVLVRVVNPVIHPSSVSGSVHVWVSRRTVGLRGCWPYAQLTPDPAPPAELIQRAVEAGTGLSWNPSKVPPEKWKKIKASRYPSKGKKGKEKAKSNVLPQAEESTRVTNAFDVAPAEVDKEGSVWLGPEPEDFDEDDFSHYFTGGELISNLRTLILRFYNSRSITLPNGGLVFNPNDSSHIPPAIRLIGNLFCFVQGNWLVKWITSNRVAHSWATGVPTNAPNILEPEALYARDPGEVVEAKLPTISPLAYIAWKNGAGWPLKLVGTSTTGSNDVDIYVAMTDATTFFGIQYLVPGYEQDDMAMPVVPYELPDVPP